MKRILRFLRAYAANPFWIALSFIIFAALDITMAGIHRAYEEQARFAVKIMFLFFPIEFGLFLLAFGRSFFSRGIDRKLLWLFASVFLLLSCGVAKFPGAEILRFDRGVTSGLLDSLRFAFHYKRWMFLQLAALCIPQFGIGLLLKHSERKMADHVILSGDSAAPYWERPKTRRLLMIAAIVVGCFAWNATAYWLFYESPHVVNSQPGPVKYLGLPLPMYRTFNTVRSIWDTPAMAKMFRLILNFNFWVYLAYSLAMVPRFLAWIKSDERKSKWAFIIPTALVAVYAALVTLIHTDTLPEKIWFYLPSYTPGGPLWWESLLQFL